MASDSQPIRRGSVLRVIAKAVVLFVVVNLAFALADPLPLIGRVSVYNWLVPGRERLPFGENPASYNLSLFQLEAMFASHEIARPKAPDEYRVLVLGDSAVWGILLQPPETLAGQMDAAGYVAADERVVRVYNLGHPTSSLTKDLLILSDALRYDPDLIVWLVTLESLPPEKQLASPILQHNPEAVRDLIAAHALDLDPADPAFVNPTFWEQTLVGQRRALADVIRLNVYGVMWAGTGVDQFYPESYDRPANDLEADVDFYGLPDPLTAGSLAFDVLAAGIELAGDVPVVLVNEPIFIGDGQNSDLRYNFYFPRWAYDDYRQIMADLAAERGWRYLDVWDAIPPSEFTNSAIHLTPEGTNQLMREIADWLGWAESK